MVQLIWTSHLSLYSQSVRLGLGFGHGNNKKHGNSMGAHEYHLGAHDFDEKLRFIDKVPLFS